LKNTIEYGISRILKCGFWFVDIPRTSSSSIRIELGINFGPPYGKKNLLESKYSSEQIFPDHLTSSEMINIIGMESWQKIFTFSIVRNPWDRILSLYFYRKIKNNIPESWSFTDYILNLEGATDKTNYFEYQGFRYGASEYIFDGNNKLLINHIVRYEERDTGLQFISQKLKIRNFGIISTQISKPPRVDYKYYYSTDTKRIIENKYARDIDLLGYNF